LQVGEEYARFYPSDNRTWLPVPRGKQISVIYDEPIKGLESPLVL
jgi:hypothetical protein